MKKNKMQLSSFFVFMNGWIFSVVVAFLLAGLLTTYSSPFTSQTLKDLLKDIKADQLFVHFFESENHTFSDQKKEKVFNLSEFAFTFTTNIKPTDIRTFLGRELPGFSIFDTEIVVADSRTDFTSLPVESAPPTEVLLRERDNAMKNNNGTTEVAPSVPGKKSVLIYHSHSWESFLPLLDGVTKSNEAVSSDEKLNVMAVGKKLADDLTDHGIGTVQLHNQIWDYNAAYSLSRKNVEEAMTTNKELQFLFDIHRDAMPGKDTTITINGRSYAQIFFIVGKANKNYEKNLQVATKLHEMLNAKYPGLSKGVLGKGTSEGNGIYNQDLSDKALLLEFGGVDNNLTELYNSVDAFSEIFSDYYWEAEEVNG